jgi:hypothetical protein
MENQIKTIKVYFQKANLIKELESIKNYDWIESDNNRIYCDFYAYLNDLKDVYFNINKLKQIHYSIENIIKQCEHYYNPNNFSKEFFKKAKIEIIDYENENYFELKNKIENELLPIISEYIGKCNPGQMSSQFKWGLEENLNENFKLYCYKENWNGLDYEKLNVNYYCLKTLLRDVNKYITETQEKLKIAEIENEFEEYESYSMEIDCAYIHKKIIENLIIDLENYILSYTKNKPEESKAEPKQEISKRIKPLKKFVFQGNEESILRIIDLLFNAGFINMESYNQRNAIIRDTFLKLDENNQTNEFNNKQLSSVKSQRLKDDIISEKNNDITKFRKLRDILIKIIPELKN